MPRIDSAGNIIGVASGAPSAPDQLAFPTSFSSRLYAPVNFFSLEVPRAYAIMFAMFTLLFFQFKGLCLLAIAYGVSYAYSNMAPAITATDGAARRGSNIKGLKDLPKPAAKSG